MLPALRDRPSGPRKRRRPVPLRTCLRTRAAARRLYASGLKVKAAPHNPALAATVMPNKSKIFNANSPIFGFRGYFRNQRMRRNCIAVPKTFLDGRPNLLHSRDATRAAPWPHLFQTVTCGTVGSRSRVNASIQKSSPTAFLATVPGSRVSNHHGFPTGGPEHGHSRDNAMNVVNRAALQRLQSRAASGQPSAVDDRAGMIRRMSEALVKESAPKRLALMVDDADLPMTPGRLRFISSLAPVPHSCCRLCGWANPRPTWSSCSGRSLGRGQSS